MNYSFRDEEGLWSTLCEVLSMELYVGSGSCRVWPIKLLWRRSWSTHSDYLSTTTTHPYVSVGFQMDQPGQCINNITLLWIIIYENYEVQQQRCISIWGKWTYLNYCYDSLWGKWTFLNYWYDSLWFLEWYFISIISFEINIIEKC